MTYGKNRNWWVKNHKCGKNSQGELKSQNSVKIISVVMPQAMSWNHRTWCKLKWRVKSLSGVIKEQA